MKTCVHIQHILLFYFIFFARLVMPYAQSPVTFYLINNRTAVTQTSNSMNGWNAVAPYEQASMFQNNYGRDGVGLAGLEREIMAFNIGSRAFSRSATGSIPFNRVVVNRHPLLSGDTINTFYESGTTSGTNLYLRPSYIGTLEGVVNSFVCNRGSDNLFSNSPSTRANIERLDLMQTAGIYCMYPNSQGFLINERGGNDNFKVAAITSLNGSLNVQSIGSLLSVQSSHWGRVGPSILTRVMSRSLASDAFLRPKQDVNAQLVSGVYITLADLGIPAGATVFGICLFPNDVTAAMNLISLSNVPTNTSQDTDGGLDMIAGMGYFVEQFLLPENGWHFSAKAKRQNVLLEWTTEQELNSDYFELQRSLDGHLFTTIGRVTAAGHSEHKNHYSFNDDLLAVNAKRVFYRILLHTKNGASFYSKVLPLRLHPVERLTIHPNPVMESSAIQFVSSQSSIASISLLSSSGKVLVQKNMLVQKGLNSFRLSDFGSILPGVYYVKLTVSEQSISTSFLKVF